MTRRHSSAPLALVAFLLASCATVAPIPDAREPCSIKAAAGGFSPAGDEEFRTMRLELSFGHRESVQSWTVRIASGSGLVREFSGVAPDLPASLSWDGTAGPGLPCPEGEYYAMLTANYGEAFNPSPVAWTAFKLIASRPAVAVEADPDYLAPIGEGMARPARIGIRATASIARVARWAIDILDDRGEVVRSFEGAAAEAAAAEEGAADGAVADGAGAVAGAALSATVDWDGMTDSGSWALPSSEYGVRARATDEYGNVGEAAAVIAVFESADPTETSSISAGAPGFSPTGDEAWRRMDLSLVFGNPEAVRSWAVEFVTGSAVLKRIEGSAADLPSTLSWDGRSAAGAVWPEGEYRARLAIDYGDSYQPASVESAPFILVSSPPAVSLSAAPPFFTPAGKGMAEPVVVDIQVSSPYAKAAGWAIEIVDPRGEVVRTFPGSGPSGKVVWDGITKAGAWVEPSRTYTARAAARDEYGNVGGSSLSVAVLAQPDAPERSSITATAAGFSPTGDPSRRAMGFSLVFGSREAVQSWTVEIMTGSVVLKRISGAGRNLPDSLSWDGISETGSAWPEGEYFAALSLEYGNAFNPVKVLSKTFLLVSSPPAVRLSAAPPFLTPAGKGMAEPVAIGIEASSRLAKPAAWSIDIVDPRGETVRGFSGAGPKGSVSWDGITKAGARAEPSKTYVARASARDEYGNVGRSELAIAIRGRSDAPERSSIGAATAGFSPTRESSHRSMELLLRFGNPEEVQSWSVEIMTGSVAVKKVSGTGKDLPSSLSWDGASEAGTVWPEGEYYALLSVDYGNSFNPARTSSEAFFLVSTPPELQVSALPRYFTPKGQGMEEPVSISLESSSKLSRIADWSVAVKDERGETVASFSGEGGSGKARWDGAIRGGAYAEPSTTFTALATARDEYGNAGSASLAIAVRERPDAPDACIIETDLKGFSPHGEKSGGRIDFSVMIGNAEAMKSWKIEIARGEEVAKTFRGSSGDAPVTLSWDGRDEGGAIAPEGGYGALLSVDYGRTYKPASARTKEFVLASSPPTGRLSFAPDSFVPSEKGVTAPVSIMLEASSRLGRIEDWSLDIRDAQGRLARSFSRKWPANQAVWDGSTLEGGYVEPASSYLAKARIVDEYGNEGYASAAISVLEVPTATEPSVIVPRASGFSPLAQGKPRSIDFILRVGNQAQMKSWKLAIAHAERGTQKSFGGSSAAPPPGTMSWDGKTDSSATAPDGNYYATLTIDYGKSFKPSVARSEPFALQAAAPEVSLELSPAKLTPRAGAFEKPVTIALRSSSRFAEMESWTISILDQAGKTIAFFKDSAGDGRVSWDGMTSAGSYVEASTVCSVLAEARDGFGNTGSALAYIPVDDLPPVVGETSIVPAASGFSPNGDGTMDSLDLRLSIANKEAIRSWKVVVSHADRGAQKTFSGDAASLGASITWTGGNDTGGPSPEGFYSAELSVDYGTIYKAVSARSRRFVLAAAAPTGKIAIAPASVVPDEDGLVAPAVMTIDALSPYEARMASWKAAVIDLSGRTLKSFEGSWPPGSVSWDGVAQDGSLAQPRTSYSVVATVRDEFGISGELRASLAVDDLPAATEESGIAAVSKGFSPAVGGVQKFALAFGNPNLIKSWSIDIERDDRTVRMSFPGAASELPGSFAWNGRLQDGTVAPDGRYLATLNIHYGRVYSPAAMASQEFILAATPPECSLMIEPALFSPDGDGETESLVIRLAAGSRLAEISDWDIEVLDPGGNLFASFSGQGPVVPITWNGRNSKGETVESAEDYPVTARVRDEFGNVGEAKSAAQVDILVVKVGDGYRIRVASIVFKSFTADYLDVQADRAERNVTTLNLLAAKLRKFPDYQIKIVGHAVMVNWDDPVKGKAEQEKVLLPLSRSRAESIRQALATRGIEATRMVTDGVGAADQIVPDSDFENRWKNRRVEFFLQKRK